MNIPPNTLSTFFNNLFNNIAWCTPYRITTMTNTFTAPSARQATASIRKAVTSSKRLNDDLTIALSHCVFHNMGHGNHDFGVRLYREIATRYKASVKDYLVEFGGFTYDKDLDVVRSKKGLSPNVESTLALCADLPSFADYTKASKAKTAVALPDITKALNSTLSRANKALSTLDINDKDVLASTKMLNALESYKDNISNGVALEDAVNASKNTIESIARDTLKAFETELLEGKTTRAIALRNKIYDQFMSSQVKTDTQIKAVPDTKRVKSA